MAKSSSENVIITDGSLDFSKGVDSNKVTTIQSQLNPNGLARNELAWLNNASVRDAGILQRTGWHDLVHVATSTVLFQGGYMYAPNFANPYLIILISGHVVQVLLDPPYTVTDLSAAFGQFMPATVPQAFFVQGEEFLIIQSGDSVTLPLFWDGAILRRSNGFNPTVFEIPAATCMDYFMGRIWYAQGRTYSAGDIVRGPSGTPGPPYDTRDSILKVTENPLVLSGDGFTVPTQNGNIRCLTHTANLNSPLGQGQLIIGTRKAIYTLNVPVTRAQWSDAAFANNQPLQAVIQLTNGMVNDRSVVPVNGDLYFQSLEPAIRSLFTAVRNFGQPGNTIISSNEERVLAFNDRALLRFSSGIQFDDRLWQTALPKQVAQGVIHQAIIPMDFVPISSFNVPFAPVWEGMYEGLDVLQMFTGDFGGLERAFSVIVSRDDQSIRVWEMTNAERFENGDNRVTWQIEFPAYTWGKEFLLKRLASGELWFDKIFGEVVVRVDYRPDSDPCWYPWTEFKMCAARDSCETVQNPVCYPTIEFRESYRATATLPMPKAVCEAISKRPANVAYQIQPRLTITGWCRVRGILLHAEPMDRQLYAGLVC